MRKTQLKKEVSNLASDYRELKNKYKYLYDSAPIAYFNFDRNGTMIEVNDGGAALLGLTRKTILNKNFSRYIAPDFQHVFYKHCQLMYLEKTPHVCELKLLKKNGLLFFIRLHSKLIINKDTGESYILSFVSHVSKHNDQPLQLMVDDTQIKAADKLTTLIAKEINNPLTIINNYLHGCIRRLESGDFDVLELLDAMRQAILQSQRMMEIILRIKNFNCRGILNHEIICINHVIQNALKLLHIEFKSFPFEIVCRLTKDLPLTLADKVHLEHVILNLLRNAVESMRDAHTRHPKLIIESNFINATLAEIKIIDNGPGLEPQIYEKLFSINFTTKPYGVGIGLAMSRTIIQCHGGDIFADPPSTRGACFRMTLALEKN